MAWVQLRLPQTCYTARLEMAKFVFIRFKRTFVIQARPKRSCKGDFPLMSLRAKRGNLLLRQ